MAVASDVNYEELARSTDEFNGAQLKAVCVEAGMIALREGATKLSHEHFLSGIAEGEYPWTTRQTMSGADMHALDNSTEQEEEPAQLLHVVFSSWHSFGRLGNVLCFSCRIASGLMGISTSPRLLMLVGLRSGTLCPPRIGFRPEAPRVSHAMWRRRRRQPA